MTLEHAETSQKTRVFSAQSLALVNALFYSEKDGQEDATTPSALTINPNLSGGPNVGYEAI